MEKSGKNTRIRLGSMEMGYLTEDIIRKMAQLKTLCPHFHLSLQSGSDTVLKRMGRRYDTNDYKKTVEAIRKYFYKPSVTTDIICGFPGESEEEFEETLEFAKQIAFSGAHIFPYSRREGTKADKFPDQLTQAVKKERVRILNKVCQKTKEEYEASLLGEACRAVVEEEKTAGGCILYTGRTERYLEVLIEKEKAQTEGGVAQGILARDGKNLILKQKS